MELGFGFYENSLAIFFFLYLFVVDWVFFSLGGIKMGWSLQWEECDTQKTDGGICRGKDCEMDRIEISGCFSHAQVHAQDFHSWDRHVRMGNIRHIPTAHHAHEHAHCPKGSRPMASCLLQVGARDQKDSETVGYRHDERNCGICFTPREVLWSRSHGKVDVGKRSRDPSHSVGCGRLSCTYA